MTVTFFSDRRGGATALLENSPRLDYSVFNASAILTDSAKESASRPDESNARREATRRNAGSAQK
jgi:hypothetical protein